LDRGSIPSVKVDARRTSERSGQGEGGSCGGLYPTALPRKKPSILSWAY
jgi:hypothetical protein